MTKSLPFCGCSCQGCDTDLRPGLPRNSSHRISSAVRPTLSWPASTSRTPVQVRAFQTVYLLIGGAAAHLDVEHH